MCQQAQHCLETYIFSSQPGLLFAFDYGRLVQPSIPAELDGWRLYDPLAEFRRQGLPNQNYRLSFINRDYQLCETYPSVLVVPQSHLFSDAQLRSMARFRSRGRIPALTW